EPAAYPDLALHPDLAAVAAGHRLDEREAETGPAVLAGAAVRITGSAGGRPGAEPAEDVGQPGLLDPRAAVRDHDRRRRDRRVAFQGQPDEVARHGVLDRVLQQRVHEIG